MKGLLQFVKTTVLGGLVFLLPLVALVIILGKAVQLSRGFAEPLSRFIPIDTFAGVAMANLLGGLAILLVCFFAGVLASTSLASKFVREAESRFLWQLPGYNLVKGVVGSAGSEESFSSMAPVLVKLDDGSQFALEMERLEDGRVVVYTPGAPNPWSGAIMVVDAIRVEALPITVIQLLQNVRMLGRGTHRFLGRKSVGGDAA